MGGPGGEKNWGTRCEIFQRLNKEMMLVALYSLEKCHNGCLLIFCTRTAFNRRT